MANLKNYLRNNSIIKTLNGLIISNHSSFHLYCLGNQMKKGTKKRLVNQQSMKIYLKNAKNSRNFLDKPQGKFIT